VEECTVAAKCVHILNADFLPEISPDYAWSGKIPEFDPFDSLGPAVSESDSLSGDKYPEDSLTA